MSRGKFFLVLSGLSVAVSGCGTMCSENAKCDIVEQAVRGYKFRSCRESLDDKVMREFDLIARIKEYSKVTFGFGDTTNYSEYRDGRFVPEGTNYRLFVSPKNMLPGAWENYQYVAGNIQERREVTKPTIFYSTKDTLEDELEYYKGRGYETHWRSFNNYGEGCGITPELINSSIEWKVSVVLHEDWHYNFRQWRGNTDSNINEGAASFVGFIGAADFILKEFGADSGEYHLALAQVDSRFVRAKFFNKYYLLLKQVFDSGLEEEDKDAIRKKILKRAKVEYRKTSVMEIYNEMPYSKNFILLWDVYNKQGKDIGKMREILHGLPGSEAEAISYLKKFL